MRDDVSYPARASRLVDYLLALTPALLAIALYAYAVRLPFFLDDAPHFVILGQTDGLRHWGNFDAFPFYRPFTLNVWLLFASAGYPAFAMHALNVLLWALIGVLVGAITHRLSRLRLAGVLAGCFVVAFPFAYQAVAMVAALFHLLLMTGACLCVWAALRFYDSGRRRYLVLCWGAAFVAIFSHESGVMLVAGLPLALIVAGSASRRDWRLIRRVSWPVWALAVLYLALWIAFSPNEEARTLSAAPLTALAALLQGIAHPMIALVRPLWPTGDAPVWAVLALCAVTVGAVLAVVRLSRRRLFPVALYGVAWYLLAIIPAVLALPPGYVLGQLRLSLLAAVGAGLLWGVLIAEVYERRRWLALVMVALIAYVSVTFVQMRRADFLALGRWNDGLTALASANGWRGDLALINAPMYLVPNADDRRFLLGSEGIIWTDPTLDYAGQIWMNSNLLRDDVRVLALVNPALIAAQGVGYVAHGEPLNVDILRSADVVVGTRFEADGGFWPYVAGGRALDLAESAGVVYPDIPATLDAASWSLDADSGAVALRTVWRLDAPAPVRLFAHLLCEGELVAQADGYVLGDSYPFNVWRADDQPIRDQRVIALPDGVRADCLRVAVGLYDESTIERLTATVDGSRLPDDAYFVPRSADG
ncbi:MAG: hypothetical protein EA396_07095 [Anaerolineaceae bacterium]|nr:MAG: hypothetical protein EA396_07095 [Anaerolineaceae bacterium]